MVARGRAPVWNGARPTTRPRRVASTPRVRSSFARLWRDRVAGGAIPPRVRVRRGLSCIRRGACRTRADRRRASDRRACREDPCRGSREGRPPGISASAFARSARASMSRWFVGSSTARTSGRRHRRTPTCARLRSPWLSVCQRSAQSGAMPRSILTRIAFSSSARDEVFEERGDLVGPLFAVDRETAEADLSRVGREKTGGELEDRGFSRAVRADDPRPPRGEMAGERLDERARHPRVGEGHVSENRFRPAGHGRASSVHHDTKSVARYAEACRPRQARRRAKPSEFHRGTEYNTAAQAVSSRRSRPPVTAPRQRSRL